MLDDGLGQLLSIVQKSRKGCESDSQVRSGVAKRHWRGVPACSNPLCCVCSFPCSFCPRQFPKLWQLTRHQKRSKDHERYFEAHGSKSRVLQKDASTVKLYYPQAHEFSSSQAFAAAKARWEPPAEQASLMSVPVVGRKRGRNASPDSAGLGEGSAAQIAR